MIYWLDCLIFLFQDMRDGSRYLLSVLTSLFLASRYSCISFALASSSCPASRNNCRVDEFSASNSSTSCFSLELKWHKNATFKCLHQRIWNVGSFPYFKFFGLHQNYEMTANRILYEVLKLATCVGDLKELTCLVPMYWLTLPDFQFSLLSVQFDPFSVWEAWWGRKPARRNGLQWFPNE